MQKHFFSLAFFALTLFSCSTDDDIQDPCKEIWGGSKNCTGTDCTYKLRYGISEDKQEEMEVNQTTYEYYTERWENEEAVCFEGMK